MRHKLRDNLSKEIRAEAGFENPRVSLRGTYTIEPMHVRYLETEKKPKRGRFNRVKLKEKQVVVRDRKDLIDALGEILRNRKVSADEYRSPRSIYQARLIAAQTLRDREDGLKRITPGYIASADPTELYDLMRKTVRDEDIRKDPRRSLNEILFLKYRERRDNGRIN